MSKLTTRIVTVLVAVTVMFSGLTAAPAAHAAPSKAKTCAQLVHDYAGATHVSQLSKNVHLCKVHEWGSGDRLIGNWGKAASLAHSGKLAEAKDMVSRDWAAIRGPGA